MVAVGWLRFMQKTRQKILEFLKQRGEATVEELSEALDDLTAVTVRHHLDVLRSQELVDAPVIRHRNSPGRPRYVYTLTSKAEALFPKNVNTLTQHVLSELKASLGADQVNVLFEGVAERMAAEIEPGSEGETFEERLDRVVEHLTDHGYEAHWEEHPEGYVLHTTNCPYTGIVEAHDDLCMLDAKYISHLLGTVPRRVGRLRDGEESCSYLITRSQVISA